MLSPFKLLVFYPLWLCTLLFFLTVPEEVVHNLEHSRVIVGDPLLATEIVKEPKLLSRWVGADKLVPKVTTAYVDETKVKRFLVNLDLPTGEGLPHILTEIISRTLESTAQTHVTKT